MEKIKSIEQYRDTDPSGPICLWLIRRLENVKIAFPLSYKNTLYKCNIIKKSGYYKPLEQF